MIGFFSQFGLFGGVSFNFLSRKSMLKQAALHRLLSVHIFLFNALKSQTSVHAALPDALRETEYYRRPLSWVHTDIYEEDVSFSGRLPRLGRGRFGFCQRHFGLELQKQLFAIPMGEKKKNFHEKTIF